MADVGSVTELDLPHDGRALAVCDWDADGQNDIFLSSRTAPRLRLMRNNISDASHFVSVKLQGAKCNRDAIGARLKLFIGKNGARKFTSASASCG